VEDYNSFASSGSTVGLWGLANVLQCGLAISICSFSSYSFSNQPKKIIGEFFSLACC
jgi:hypothetical protein